MVWIEKVLADFPHSSIVILVLGAVCLGAVCCRLKALVSMEGHFGFLAESALHAMIMVNEKGAIRFINRQGENFFGYTRDELIGQPVEILMPERFRENHPALRDSFFKAPSTRMLGDRREFFARRKDGQEVSVEIGINPIKRGNKCFAVASIIDITHRRSFEKLKDEFISNVSHELRTPLTVIGLGIENLCSGLLGPLSEKQASVLARNERNVNRLRKLIENLLDLSRLESGQSMMRSRAVCFRDLIHDVVEIFDLGDREGEIIFKKEIHADLPELVIDPDMISQVLTNILSNSFRYAVTEVVLRVQEIKGAGDAKPFIQTSIENDGLSIPDDQKKNLFNKFSQLERRIYTGAYKGTGLGLAICKAIIEQHRGKIWVENRERRGVAFHFTLPVDEGKNG